MSLRAFASAHQGALWALGAGAAALALFWATRSNRTLMNFWVDRVSMPVKRALGAVTNPLPFSVCEAGATLLILGALALLGRAIWHTAHGHPAALGAWMLHLVVCILWGYVGVCAFWGTQYYADSFADKAGIHTAGVSAEQLAAVTRYFARKAADCAGNVPRSETGCFGVTREEIFAGTAGLYDGITDQWPFLEGPERRAKPAFYSKLMSAWGFTGYLCPLTGESTLNVDCPEVFLPVTIAHEFAHQRGVAAEQEANFVGIMASITSGQADYVYSGWLFGYLHLYNALCRVDPAAASASMAAMPAEVRADFAWNNSYWASWEGPVQEVGESVYNAFLESYGQDLGIQSYGACVDLLVEVFLPLASQSV